MMAVWKRVVGAEAGAREGIWVLPLALEGLLAASHSAGLGDVVPWSVDLAAAAAVLVGAEADLSDTWSRGQSLG